jgi:hypothetical protein
MKKSNIFAYVEVSKLAEMLQSSSASAKEALKSQAAYFNIIDPKYFSDRLADDWLSILTTVKQYGPVLDEEGKVVQNAISNTIEKMSENECERLKSEVFSLHEKLKKEYGS